MPRITARSAADPVSQAIVNSPLMAGKRPVPLVATSYAVDIRGGLADVVAVRIFRNVEPESIEATLTFPISVHAALYSLEVRIGERRLRAHARAKTDARADYEDAIGRGKTAILHEELIKGVHLLSVGLIAPNTDVEVTIRFAQPLSRIGEHTQLRIPTTVGDVYGASGFEDCDELCHGGAVQSASLSVVTDSGSPDLLHGRLIEGKSSIALDRPIEIEVENWRPREIIGVTAEQTTVALDISPVDVGDDAIDCIVLVDRSGSMAGPCAAGAMTTKFQAALSGLNSVAGDLRSGDKLHLFQFDDAVEDLGLATAANWCDRIGSIAPPNGGTEIGNAITFAMTKSSARNLIIVTDGKSHALDINELARSERRFTVVLIGEDSLDANVGHLAVLTGGDILVPSDQNVATGVRSAFVGLRAAGSARTDCFVQGGMKFTARWRNDKRTASAIGFERAVAAYAASLRLASLDAQSATKLAEDEGLVSYLTSLIVVDEEGATQDGLPAVRKIALPTPAASDGILFAIGARASASELSLGCRPAPVLRSFLAAPAAPRAAKSCMHAGAAAAIIHPGHKAQRSGRRASADTSSVMLPTDLSDASLNIDWASHGDALSRGNLAVLDSHLEALILNVSESAIVRRAARRLKISRVLLVIGVLASSLGDGNRHAGRVARAILGHASPRLINQLVNKLCPSSGGRTRAA